MTNRFHVNTGRRKEKADKLKIFKKYFNPHMTTVICSLLPVAQEILKLLVTGAQS